VVTFLSVCLCDPHNSSGPEETDVTRQRLGKHIPVVMNTRNNTRTITRSVLYAVRVI
jgi:hypothetical protein